MVRWTIGLVVLAGVGLIGCTGQSSPNPAESSAAPQAPAAAIAPAQPAPQPIAVPASASPDQVVTVFLNALRTGDSPTTESLLTSKAREELARHELSVDVQSAPNATYQVQPAEILAGSSGGAHVRSIWTEKYDDGAVEPYEIIWVLRQQAEGWRLAGMAMQLLPGQDPQFLNFEDPGDMLRKKDEAMAALEAAAAQTAQQPPGAPGQSPATIER